MNLSEDDKGYNKKLYEELKKTTDFLELLKGHFQHLYYIRMITIYVAVLLSVVVIWLVWYAR